MDTQLDIRIATLELPREVTVESELVRFAEQITDFFAELFE